jgi:hypothetical protein
MSDVIPLRDILTLTPEDVHEALTVHAANSRGVTSMRDRLASLGESVGAAEINEALETDVFGLIAQGWVKLRAVRDAAKKSLESPDTTTMVTLGEHKITTDCHPVLELKLAELTLTELKFTVELEVMFKSVKLAIRDARIRSLAPGEASVTARLKYGQVKLKEQSTKSWQLPGTIEMDEGIAVA